jgi:hypothetical protein
MDVAVACPLELDGGALFAVFAKGAEFGTFAWRNRLELRYGEAEAGHAFHSLKTRTLQEPKSAAPSKSGQMLGRTLCWSLIGNALKRMRCGRVKRNAGRMPASGDPSKVTRAFIL